MPRLVKYYNLYNLSGFLRELQIWTILYRPLKDPDSHEGCPYKDCFLEACVVPDSHVAAFH